VLDTALDFGNHENAGTNSTSEDEPQKPPDQF
jgi:hypothetical protein